MSKKAILMIIGAVLLAAVLVLTISDDGEPFCVTDLEIVTSVELPTGLLTCTTNGQIQLRYRVEGGFFRKSKDFEPENNAFIASRQAFAALEVDIETIAKFEDRPRTISSTMTMFEEALFEMTLYARLEGPRGALYLAAYFGMMERINPKTLPPELAAWPQLLIILDYYELGGYDEYFQTDTFLDFAICFWEADIPEVPFELAVQSELITLCIESERFKF